MRKEFFDFNEKVSFSRANLLAYHLNSTIFDHHRPSATDRFILSRNYCNLSNAVRFYRFNIKVFSV